MSSGKRRERDWLLSRSEALSRARPKWSPAASQGAEWTRQGPGREAAGQQPPAAPPVHWTLLTGPRGHSGLLSLSSATSTGRLSEKRPPQGNQEGPSLR